MPTLFQADMVPSEEPVNYPPAPPAFMVIPGTQDLYRLVEVHQDHLLGITLIRVVNTMTGVRIAYSSLQSFQLIGYHLAIPSQETRMMMNDPDPLAELEKIDPERAARIREIQREEYEAANTSPRIKEWLWLLGKRLTGRMDLTSDSAKIPTTEPVEPGQVEEQGHESNQHYARHLPETDFNPNVVISLGPDEDIHYPLFDLDLSAHLIPSTTTGHSHLYINTPITTEQYQAILDAFVAAGIVQQGFARRLEIDGFCTFRLPWIQKESNHDPGPDPFAGLDPF